MKGKATATLQHTVIHGSQSSDAAACSAAHAIMTCPPDCFEMSHNSQYYWTPSHRAATLIAYFPSSRSSKKSPEPQSCLVSDVLRLLAVTPKS